MFSNQAVNGFILFWFCLILAKIDCSQLMGFRRHSHNYQRPAWRQTEQREQGASQSQLQLPLTAAVM